MSPRSGQTFSRAWNRRPGLRWTHWLIILYAAAAVIWSHHVGHYFQSLSFLKPALRFPCPVDRDDIVPLRLVATRPELFGLQVHVALLVCLYNFHSRVHFYVCIQSQPCGNTHSLSPLTCEFQIAVSQLNNSRRLIQIYVFNNNEWEWDYGFLNGELPLENEIESTNTI